MSNSAFDQACDWIVRLDSDQADARDRAEFVRWLNRSSENAHAYEEMAQIWARLDTMVPEAREALVHLAPDHWYQRLPRLLASLVAIIGLMVAAVIYSGLRPSGLESHQFVTATDQLFEYQASDGSNVRLQSLTSLGLHYSRDLREVAMQHGTATFDVTTNPGRPFIVLLDDYVVQSLGTEFLVTRNESEIIVQVFEGKVSFAREPRSNNIYGEGQAPFVVLQQEQSMHFDLATETIQVKRFDSTRKVWQSPPGGND